MYEQDIRNIVQFVRSRQPRFYTDKDKNDLSLKVNEEDFYWCNLYDRRSELLKNSKEYDMAMDEIYIEEAKRYFNFDE